MIHCNIDGSIAPMNPGGRMGIGVIISDNHIETLVEIHKEFEAKPENTNNVAEYLALLECLRWLDRNGYPDNEIQIQSDSEVLVRQCNGIYRVKEYSDKHMTKYNFYYPIAIEARKLMKAFPHISFMWVPREQNMKADSLSKIIK